MILNATLYVGFIDILAILTIPRLNNVPFYSPSAFGNLAQFRFLVLIASGITQSSSIIAWKQLASGRIVGGVVGRDYSSDGSASASAECYDPHRQQWRKLPDMGIARAECVAASLDGLLCVVGGACEDIPLASAECFDASTGQWCMYR